MDKYKLPEGYTYKTYLADIAYAKEYYEKTFGKRPEQLVVKQKGTKKK